MVLLDPKTTAEHSGGARTENEFEFNRGAEGMNAELVKQHALEQDHWNDLFSTKLIEALDRIAVLEKQRENPYKGQRWLWMLSVAGFLLGLVSLAITLGGLT